MREKNNQTNKSQMFQEKNSFNKKTLIFFKRLLAYENLTSILFLIAICIISILALTNNSFATFTAQEMEEFQGNEMISGMCYVYKIMTSNITKAIAAAFVMGSGWLFFWGGIKDWKPVLSLSIAITLIFGGFEIANIISRNDYTCNKIIEEIEKNKNDSTEKTTYTIKEIEAYSPGQEWKICDKDAENLNFANCETIDENDEISVDDDRDLVLYKCQSDYIKILDNVYLKYRYDTGDKLAGKFILLNSANISNLSTGTNSTLEQIKCKLGCKLSKLTKLLEVYHAKSTESNNNTFQILNNSGKIKENKYLTAGTQISLDCLEGYEEYDKNNKLDKFGLIAICSDNGEFKFEGNCKGKCYLDKYSNRNTFTNWQKYNPKTNTWADSTANEFLYGDKVRVKTCNTADGYSFSGNSTIPDKNKLVLLCGSIGNEELWLPQDNGKSCSKFCRLSDYVYYKEHKWKKGCTITGCSQNLQNGEDLFEVGTILGISGCVDNSYNLNPNKETLRITCNENGEWEENGGTKCLGMCEPNTIKDYNYVDNWELCEDGKCRIVKYENIGEVANGATLEQKNCKTGYDFYDKNKRTIFVCKKGIFEKQGDIVNEICIAICNEASPVFDSDNLKVADKMYGITFASNNTNSAIHTYLVCYKNSNTTTLFTLNSNGTGLGSVRPGDYVECSYENNDLASYVRKNNNSRKLTCKQNSNVNDNKPYWQSIAKSCDLNELKIYSGINVQLAYGGFGAAYVKDINTIMTDGSKQTRFLSYYNNSYVSSWSMPYATSKSVKEEGSITDNVEIICNSNGTWTVTITKVKK